LRQQTIQFGEVSGDSGQLLGHCGELRGEAGDDGVMRCGHAGMVATPAGLADE